MNMAPVTMRKQNGLTTWQSRVGRLLERGKMVAAARVEAL